MDDTTCTTENASDVSPGRPRYIILGRDRLADTHIYRTVDETIFVISPGGKIAQRYDLGDRPLDVYRKFVEEKREWLDWNPHTKADITDPFALMGVK